MGFPETSIFNSVAAVNKDKQSLTLAIVTVLNSASIVTISYSPI